MQATRVDHVGSLLRPAYLKDAFRRFAQGELPEAELRAVQDRAIREVVARQESIGLPVITDGEYRRLNWQVSFSEVEGWDMWRTSWDNFRRHPENRAPTETPLTRGEDAVLSFRTPVTARLSLKRNSLLQEFDFIRRPAAKVTLMGPDRVAQMSDIDGSPYRDPDEFRGDVVRIQRRIVEELLRAGCRYVQLDEPTRAQMRARGEDPDENFARSLRADNALIDDFPDVTFGIHLCRGNERSMWHREGTYDAIAERLFGGLRFERLLLEYDTARAGGFEPLRFVPKGVTVVLGLITTKTGQIEKPEDLFRRIDDAARFIPLEQLALSPQCGFASGIAGNLLSEEEQWRKLELMMDVARQVWR